MEKWWKGNEKLYPISSYKARGALDDTRGKEKYWKRKEKRGVGGGRGGERSGGEMKGRLDEKGREAMKLV